MLLALEHDVARLDLAVAHVDLVTAEDDGDALAADAHQVAVPRGHVLVGRARGHVEHDQRGLSVYVVAFCVEF